MIHYGDRLFRAVETQGDGDVGGDTLFRYEQRGDMLMGTYSGGEVEWGTLVGTVRSDGSLTFLYQHRTKAGKLRSGRCESKPEILKSGRIRLHERWQWHGRGGTPGAFGQSVIEEV